jgi:hypothetical protein
MLVLTRRHACACRLPSDRDRVSPRRTPSALRDARKHAGQRLLCSAVRLTAPAVSCGVQASSCRRISTSHSPRACSSMSTLKLHRAPPLPIPMLADNVSATMPFTPRAPNLTSVQPKPHPSAHQILHSTHAPTTPPVQETEASANPPFVATPLTPSGSTGAHVPRLRDEDIPSYRHVCLRLREGGKHGGMNVADDEKSRLVASRKTTTLHMYL